MRRTRIYVLNNNRTASVRLARQQPASTGDTLQSHKYPPPPVVLNNRQRPPCVHCVVVGGVPNNLSPDSLSAANWDRRRLDKFG